MQQVAVPKLGCSKCRYSKNGCGQCRAAREEALQNSVQHTHQSPPLLGRTPRMRCLSQLDLQPAASAQQQRKQQHGHQHQEQEDPLPAARRTSAGATAASMARGRRGSGKQVPDTADAAAAAAAPARAAPAVPAAAGAVPAPQRLRRRSAAGAAAHGSGGSIWSTNGGVFSGKAFLVTGISGSGEDKRRVEQTIRQHGGILLSDVPDGEAGGLAAVVAERAVRTPKYLFGIVSGCAVVKPAHLQACVAAGKWLLPQPGHTLAASLPEPPRVFAGARLALHGPPGFIRAFGLALEHAGATLVPGAVALQKPAKGARTIAAAEEHCDAIIVETGEAVGEAGRVLQEVRRSARRHRIPVRPREWALQALLDRQRPAELPPAPNAAAPQPPQQQAAAPSCGPSADAPTPSAAEPSGRRGGRRKSAAAAAADAAPSRGNSGGGMSRQAVAAAPDVAAAEIADDPEAGGGDDVMQTQEWSQPAEAPHWLQKADGPSLELGLPATPFRTYYTGFQRGSLRVEVGDAVRLAPATGETHDTIGQLQALWAEKPVDGQPRMLARCRRLYRPQETVFMSTGSAAELFMSDHIEARVPIADIAAKCIVNVQPPGALPPCSPAADSGAMEEVFTCMYHFDHEAISLTPLPGL